MRSTIRPSPSGSRTWGLKSCRRSAARPIISPNSRPTKSSAGLRSCMTPVLRRIKSKKYELGIVIGAPLELDETLRWHKARLGGLFPPSQGSGGGPPAGARRGERGRRKVPAIRRIEEDETERLDRMGGAEVRRSASESFRNPAQARR